MFSILFAITVCCDHQHILEISFMLMFFSYCMNFYFKNTYRQTNRKVLPLDFIDLCSYHIENVWLDPRAIVQCFSRETLRIITSVLSWYNWDPVDNVTPLLTSLHCDYKMRICKAGSCKQIFFISRSRCQKIYNLLMA